MCSWTNESLCCIPESNTMVQINCMPTRFIKRKPGAPVTRGPSELRQAGLPGSLSLSPHPALVTGQREKRLILFFPGIPGHSTSVSSKRGKKKTKLCFLAHVLVVLQLWSIREQGDGMGRQSTRDRDGLWQRVWSWIILTLVHREASGRHRHQETDGSGALKSWHTAAVYLCRYISQTL